MPLLFNNLKENAFCIGSSSEFSLEEQNREHTFGRPTANDDNEITERDRLLESLRKGRAKRAAEIERVQFRKETFETIREEENKVSDKIEPAKINSTTTKVFLAEKINDINIEKVRMI